MWQILLVDDDRQEQELLAQVCSRLAHVVCASTAAEAHRVIATHVVHLVVLEHRLPDASGLDLLAAIKAQCPRLPVIMSTASGSEAVCASALKLGVRDYFIKPWAPAEVVASIRAILIAAVRQQAVRPNVLGAQGRLEPRTLAGRTGQMLSIRRAAEQIKDDPSDPRFFGQLARELHLSKPALSRRFTRVVGVSYRRLVIDCRIARAQELLTSSDRTVTEIAQLVGFGDLPRFDKVFKALVGASPSIYRQQQTRIGNNLLARRPAV
jgi:YesN/AraC family two-component response regulator